MNEDARLIRRAREGDTEAFGQLVRKHQDRLFNSMAHVVGCPEEAEDIVQDAFVQAFLKLETFRGDSAFFTWIYRIAFNQSISRRRRNKRAISLERVREAAGAEPVDRAEAPGERLLRCERADELYEALGALREEYRIILVLREIDGCDYATMAEILDVPVGTVRSRLHRARLQLRDRLKGTLPENSLD